MLFIYNFVMFLFVITLFLGVTGLIKPKLFKKVLHKRANRKFIILTTISLLFGLAILGSITEPANVKQARLASQQASKTAKEIEQDSAISDEKSKDSPKPKNKTSTQTIPNPRYYWHKVIKVVDGDTVKALVDGKEESIRIIGIDTPESVDPRKTVECFALESTNKAKELLENKWIQLESDSTQGNRDKYNRLLRYVWTNTSKDFGKSMIEEGYAHEYTYNTPYNKQAQYKAVYVEARNSSKGLWSPDTCNGQKTKPTITSTTTPKPTPSPTPKPTPTAPPNSSNCNPNYSPCVPNSPTDLNCPDIGFRVTVIGTDVYRLDNDSDGIGCDSY